jgi:hypothetical protein
MLLVGRQMNQIACREKELGPLNLNRDSAFQTEHHDMSRSFVRGVSLIGLQDNSLDLKIAIFDQCLRFRIGQADAKRFR